MPRRPRRIVEIAPPTVPPQVAPVVAPVVRRCDECSSPATCRRSAGVGQRLVSFSLCSSCDSLYESDDASALDRIDATARRMARAS